jgi:hypothetical protein
LVVVVVIALHPLAEHPPWHIVQVIGCVSVEQYEFAAPGFMHTGLLMIPVQNC